MNFFILMGAIVFLQLDVCYTVSLKALTGRQKNNHKNISNLLDSLLRGYENSIRPNYGGAPAEIEVDFMVRSMGPISEVDMTYSMDCYFRQSWVDKRLAFPGDVNDTLALSISMLERIWKPDTYFHNGKQSYLHTITTPNKFVRLYQNGRVLYSSRLTIKAGCPMNLEDFPMDVQRCPLVLGSFGYTARDILYKWNSARQVAIAEDMKLSQFDLVTTPSSSERKVVMGYHRQTGLRSFIKMYLLAVLVSATDIIWLELHQAKVKSGIWINIKPLLNNVPNKLYVEVMMVPNPSSLPQEYTNLLVSFHLKRHMGNFLIQVYGPCVLLVVLSWVSFWLNREATADRVSLGITTVLTMTFLGLEARNDLPKVPYPTALDYFVFLSFAFIFATIIEFAVVHYFTKYGSGECYFSSDFDSDTSSDDEEVNADENRNAQVTHRRRYSEGNSHISSSDLEAVEVIPLAMYSVPRRNNPPSIKCNCCVGSNHEKIKPPAQVTTSIARPRKLSSSYHHEIKLKPRRHRTPRFNSVSKIDRISRVVFPFLFLAINAFYWYSYLYKTQRIEQS